MCRIMFVCHGNICRSPMAEFVLKDMIKKKGLEDSFFVESSATSCEELGSDVHKGTKRKLFDMGIACPLRRARQLNKNDFDKYDYFIAMDNYNVANIHRILGDNGKLKTKRLLEFAGFSRDIADPWYTGNFDQTYEDIFIGCEALLNNILNQFEKDV